MKKIVILTGAGISAESGIQTFRDSGGLWEGYDVQEVATPEAWDRNPVLVQRFYNERRKNCREAQPNVAHTAIARLQEKYDVTVITQNIDDLHERGGAKKVIHLHGLITKSRSSADPDDLYDIDGDEIQMGEFAKDGSQKRPHVVWFGEDVPMIHTASGICYDADIFILCGTSMNVYPAAGLIKFVPFASPKYIIDPNLPSMGDFGNMVKIEKVASIGMTELVDQLLADAPEVVENTEDYPEL